MKRKGFTLIELVVVIALIAILAATLAPRLRNQIAKAKDAKAIAALGGLRTASEVYYAEEELPVTEVTDNDTDIKAIADLVDNHMDASTKEYIDTTAATAEIGASTSSDQSANLKYGGKVLYQFDNPDSSATRDGIAIWITAGTDDTQAFDTKGNSWASY